MAGTANSTIHCPVCRARQEMQPQCRRCGADLALYCQGLTAVAMAKDRYAAARERGDEPTARRQLTYLKWLSPQQAAQFSAEV